MRQRLAVGVAAALLAGLVATGATARDEDLRMGDDPAYYQRVELPEDHLVISMPGDWSVDTEIEYHPAEDGDPVGDRWTILFATDAVAEYCGISRRPRADLEPREIAALVSEIFNEQAGEGADAEWLAIDVPLGEVYRVDVHHLDEDGYSALFEFASTDFWYELACSAPERDLHSWMAIAETLEWMPEGGVDELPAKPIAPEPGEVPEAVGPQHGLERVEVPEAGVAVSFPSGWAVDIELYYDENEPGDPDTGYWRVLYADGGDEGWCDLTRNLSPVGDLADLAQLTADNFVDHFGGDTTARSTPVQLAAGEAWRFDVQVPAERRFFSGYMVDAPPGHLDEPSRFTLICDANERDDRDWLAIADTLEWLDGSADEEPGDDRDLSDAEAHGLQRVEFVEAGVALALPPEWSVELLLEEREDQLPDAYADAGPISFRALLKAEAPDGEWCTLDAHPENPMPLGDQASWNAAQWSAAFPDLSFDLYSADDWGEKRWIVMGRGADPDAGANLYFFESAGERYQLNCAGVFGPDSPWDAIAASVEPLGMTPSGPDPVASDGVLWLDLPAAGVELALPADWTFESEVEELGAYLPPPYDDVGEVTVLRALDATGPDGAWCGVYAYETMPLSLPEHAHWFESMVSSDTEVLATVELETVYLPIGEAVRLVESYDTGDVFVVYLFDADGGRRYLYCGGGALPEDAWLSVAETIAPMSAPLPEIPEGVVDWSEVNDVVTELPVTDVDVGETYMHAECGRATWFELADGSYQEVLSCELTEEPVEEQGRLPLETVTLGGGSCEWVSDFWAAYDGSEYWAESWSVTVEPDGTATAVSRYGAEALDCDD